MQSIYSIYLKNTKCKWKFSCFLLDKYNFIFNNGNYTNVYSMLSKNIG